MIKTSTRYLFLLAFLFPCALRAQFPTGIGTKWEYFQLFEDGFVPSEVIPSFEDLVVGDTVAGGNTYHVVRRTGTLSRCFIWPNLEHDTLDGTYYYRVQGDQVRVLDSVVLGTAHERLLYDFGVAMGDTLTERPVNLVNLTSPGDTLYSTYTGYYNYDLMCAGIGWCDSIYVVDSAMASPPWHAAGRTYTNFMIHYLPDVGTIYSGPILYALDVDGQNYFLNQLTVGSQVVYRNPGIAAAVAVPVAGPQIEVYPNPARDRIELSSQVAMEHVCLVDAMGKTVLERGDLDLTQDLALDVQALPRGLYWVVVKTGSGIATRAVLLQ